MLKVIRFKLPLKLDDARVLELPIYIDFVFDFLSTFGVQRHRQVFASKDLVRLGLSVLVDGRVGAICQDALLHELVCSVRVVSGVVMALLDYLRRPAAFNHVPDAAG